MHFTGLTFFGRRLQNHILKIVKLAIGKAGNYKYYTLKHMQTL